MDFGWSKEQTELRDAARELGRTLNAGLVDRDRAGAFDRQGWKTLAEFGIHGLPVPARWGGMGCDALTTVGVLEALGQGCRDNGLLFSINAQMWTATMPLLLFGSEAQQAKYLQGLCNGSLIGGNAIPASPGGSGVSSNACESRAIAARTVCVWP